MIQSVLSNMAVILLSHLLVTTIVNYRDRFTKVAFQISVIVILSATIISIFYLPIYIGDYRFDLRLIPLIMLAFFNGSRVIFPIIAIVSIWRLFLGGDGAVPGIIFGMVLPTLFALLYVKSMKRKLKVWDIIVVVTLSWFISDVPIIFFMPNGLDVLSQVFSWRYTSFLVVTFIYYIFIQLDNKRFEMKEQLQFLATHDQLTKLLTKQECIRLAELNMKTANQQSLHYFAMIDLDYFKKFNDQYGHIAGDEALVKLATVFKSFENEKLLIARFGGEEFLIYINAVEKNEAIEQIRLIQEKIRQTTFGIGNQFEVALTVSIGLAQWVEGRSIQDTIKDADANLYIAKDRGRDQLVFDS